MALPKIDTPIYELDLPLSKKHVRFRPFLVKEQKNLLMAMESGDSKSIEQNVKQVLNNCTVTENIDIEKLPVLDVEFYFLNLRARSVGEIVENKYRCDNQVDGSACGNIMETSLNLLDIKIEGVKENNDVIQLTDTISIKLKYPEFSVIRKLENAETITDVGFELVIDCIDYIYDEDNIYHAHETPKEELMQFLESLTKEQFDKIESFVDNMPKLEKKINFICSKCGFNHNINVQGLDDFFS
jgi:hypothetical protein